MSFAQEPLKNFLPKSPADKAERSDCLKHFEDKFAEYVINIFEGSDQNSAEMKYRLRHDLLIMDTFSSMQNFVFKGRTVYGVRPDRFQNCARLTTCKTYHFFSIREIFNEMCKENTASFVCPTCGGPSVTRSQQIIPDYFCYLYFTITEGVFVTLNFEREDKADILQDQRTEIYKNDNKIYNTKEKKIITVSFDNCAESFKELAMQEAYKEIRSQKQNMTNVRISSTKNPRKFETLGTTSFGLISLITSKRIKSGVLHEDCEHKEVYIFDLEGTIISLFSQDIKIVKKQIKCLYCSSVFTKENIYKKATLFSKVNSIMLSEPYTSGRMYYDNNKLQQRAEEKEYIKKEETLTHLAKETYSKMNAEEISNKVKEGLKKLVTMATSFWNKQDKQKSQKFFEDTVKKVAEKKPQNQKQHLMKIDYKKLFYPTRCKKCHSLECSDLWEYLISFFTHLNWDSIDDFKCMTCKKFKFKEDKEDLENDIYLDLEIYTLMQFGLLNIAYDFDLKRWIPDINNIAFRKFTNLNPITYVVNFLKENGKQGTKTTLKYYKTKFSLKGSPPKSECFIIDSCNNLESNTDKYDHVIFVSKEADVLSFKCPCGAKPQNILELVYDKQLAQYINQEYTDWDPESGFKKPQSKKSRIRIVQNELEFLQKAFEKELGEIRNSRRDESGRWGRNQITKYAGGVDLFTDGIVDFVRID